MSDSSPVAHEGNPKEDTLTIEGGNLLTTATLGIVTPFVLPPVVVIPPETPPPPGGGGECTPAQASTRNGPAIEQCETSEGDGVVTFPGDYDFDPVYYQQACENYYGNFVFGLNSNDIGDNPSDPPTLYVPTPDIWIPPSGAMLFNSTCPGLVSRQLVFNFYGLSAGVGNNPPSGTIPYYNLTPENFQTNEINAHNLLIGAGIGDGSEPNPVTQGGEFDCRFQFSTSASDYESQVWADFSGELGTAIAGIGMITDTGGGATITGYGLVIDRTTGTLKFVKWEDVSRDNYEVLASAPYTPALDDTLNIRVRMECPCPYVDLASRTFFPIAGSVLGTCAGHTFTTTAQSLTSTAYKAMRYAVLFSCTVENGQDLNLMGFRNVYTKFVGTHAAC